MEMMMSSVTDLIFLLEGVEGDLETARLALLANTEMEEVLDGPDFDDVRDLKGFMLVWANVLMADVDWTTVTDATLTPKQCKFAVGVRLILGYGQPFDVSAEAVLANARAMSTGAKIFECTVTGEPLLASHVQLFFDRPNVRPFFEDRL